MEVSTGALGVRLRSLPHVSASGDGGFELGGHRPQDAAFLETQCLEADVEAGSEPCVLGSSPSSQGYLLFN